MLSYCEDSGVYSAIMNEDFPQHKLTDQNAIKINTRNPVYFQQTYENTLLKKFTDAKQDHAKEQLKHIQNQN